MADIDINSENLVTGTKIVKTADEKMSSLISSFGSLSIPSEMPSSGAFNSYVESINSDKAGFADLIENLDKTIEYLGEAEIASLEYFASAAGSYSNPQEFFEEFVKLQYPDARCMEIDGGVIIDFSNIQNGLNLGIVSGSFILSNDCFGSGVKYINDMPGIGNTTDANSYKNDYIQNGVPSKTVVAISSTYGDNEDMYSKSKDLLNAMGSYIAAYEGNAFSGGTTKAFDTMERVLQDNPHLTQDDASLVILDGSWNCGNGMDPSKFASQGENYERMKALDIPIYNVTRAGAASNATSVCNGLFEVGYNVKCILAKTSEHYMVRDLAINDGLLDYLHGNTDSLENPSNYSYHADPESCNVTAGMDEIMAKGVGIDNIPRYRSDFNDNADGGIMKA